MTGKLPAPYPPETRAKGWRFELDYEQIEQSDTWDLAGPEGRPWLLMMWLTAWRQMPCGSLPGDEQVIAAKLGMPPKAWAKHRDTLMRGWWLADDGRRYHPTLTARVEEMMKRRRSDSDRQHAKRLREAAEAAAEAAASGVSHAEVTAESRVTPHSVTPESSTDNRIPTNTVSDEANASSSSAEPTLPGIGEGSEKVRPTIPCPYSAIVQAYHEALPTLPKVRLQDGPTWTARQKAMRSMWGWVLSSRKSDGTPRATTGEQALAWVAGYFRRASQNDFVMGRTPRSGEHANWRADFDFLLSQKGLKQVIEKTQEAAA